MSTPSKKQKIGSDSISSNYWGSPVGNAGEVAGWGCKELLQSMIRIPSVNPDQVSNPEDDENCGEARMAQYLAAKFREVGASLVEIEEMKQEWVHGSKHSGQSYHH